MAYPITTTSGATLTTVSDGTVNTSATSLTLIGKNYAGYGNFLNENYIKLLENFSNSTAPANAIVGQLWFDYTSNVLKVYSRDNIWKPISSSAASTQPPLSPVTGDLWWDMTNSQLKVWSGAVWITVGPTYTSVSGTTGPIIETIMDTGGGSHIVVKFYIQDTVVAILSKSTQFVPQTSIPGFSIIYPGFNLVSPSSVPGSQFTGDVSNALSLQGLTSTQFLRSDVSQTTNYAFGAAGGLTVGSDLEFASNSSVGSTISQTTSNKNIRVIVNKSGNITTALTITASSLEAHFVGNVRTSGVFDGTAITAQYADLAERFEADVPMVPGTVVELGGSKEITAVVNDLSESVFGVISTAAGFLMNSGAGTNQTHPPIAVNGRVPVRVIGKCRKGDRLVSAGNGLARAANRNELSAFNVIGRAIKDKITDDEGLVEAIVKLNS
jgi:hypothetical protein